MDINASSAGSLTRAGRTDSFSPAVTRKGAKQQGSSDRVQLSSLSESIRTEAAGSAARTGHVENIGQLVSSGHYRVDSNELSAALIRHSMAASA